MSTHRANRVALVVTITGLTFLHFALRPVFDSWIARPNLIVCAVLVAGLRMRPGPAAAVGFVLGLLEDAMAVTHFGVTTLLLVLVGFLGARVRDQFVGEEPLFIGTYLFLGTWLFQVVSYLVLGAGGSALSYILVRSPLDALATSAVGYLTLPLVRPR